LLNFAFGPHISTWVVNEVIRFEELAPIENPFNSLRQGLWLRLRLGYGTWVMGVQSMKLLTYSKKISLHVH
jgi:hypothetical protein